MGTILTGQVQSNFKKLFDKFVKYFSKFLHGFHWKFIYEFRLKCLPKIYQKLVHDLGMKFYLE